MVRLTTVITLCAMLVACATPEEYDQGTDITPVTIKDWRDEVIYQLLTDRFADGDVNNNFNVDKSAPGRYHGGDWQGVIDRMDYLETLGVTAIWISPVVKNVEEDSGFASYHGYWTQDFLKVNPHFGDMAKLRQLVDEAHRRGIKVILDVVVNHVGQLFFYDINGNGAADEFAIGGGGSAFGSDNADFPSGLTRTNEWDPDYDSRGVRGFTSLGERGLSPIEWAYAPDVNRLAPQPAEFANPEWYNRRGRVTVWRAEQQACSWVTGQQDPGYWWDNPACRSYIRQQELKGDFPGGLKDLRTERQDVRDALFKVFAYWVEEAGFDGFRIDTLKHVEPEFLADFCARMRAHVRALGRDNFFIFGEVFDGKDDLLASYVGGEGVDSVFYFSQKFTVYQGVFQDGAPTRQIETLFDMRLGAQAHYTDTPNADGPKDEQGALVSPRALMVNFMDNHDVPRFRFEFDDTQVHHNALLLLLTQDGIPSIYYGTEQRFRGGNDPDNREDLWSSGYDTQNGTFRLMQTLIALRKEHVALRRGNLQVRWSSENAADSGASDAGIFAFERTFGSDTVLVVINTNNNDSARPENGGVSMQTSFSAGTKLVNLLCAEGSEGDYGAHRCADGEGQTFTVGADGRLGQTLTLAPRSGMILVPQ